MRTRDEVVRILRDQRTYLAAEFGVRKIGLFGSYAAGTAQAASDLDLVVEFERPIGFRFLALVDYLEKLLGVGVEILTPAGLENIRSKRVADSITQSIVYV